MKRNHRDQREGQDSPRDRRNRRLQGMLLGLLLASNMFIGTGCILTDLLGGAGGSQLSGLLGGLGGASASPATGAGSNNRRNLGQGGAAAPGQLNGRAAAPTRTPTSTARPSAGGAAAT